MRRIPLDSMWMPDTLLLITTSFPCSTCRLMPLRSRAEMSSRVVPLVSTPALGTTSLLSSTITWDMISIMLPTVGSSALWETYTAAPYLAEFRLKIALFSDITMLCSEVKSLKFLERE